MAPYSIESRRGYELLSLARNLSTKYRTQLLDTRLDTSEKVPHKSAEATREFIGKKLLPKLWNLMRFQETLEK